jgi:hypothetical protein
MERLLLTWVNILLPHSCWFIKLNKINHSKRGLYFTNHDRR